MIIFIIKTRNVTELLQQQLTYSLLKARTTRIHGQRTPKPREIMWVGGGGGGVTTQLSIT